jgi:predicted small secreted protein
LHKARFVAAVFAAMLLSATGCNTTQSNPNPSAT